MTTLLVKVKNPENCHKKGFTYIKKLTSKGIEFDSILAVNKENEAVGFILTPHIQVVGTNELIQGLEEEDLFTEKPVSTVKKQLKDNPQCIIFNISPIARFGCNVGLEKQVRGTRYSTKTERHNCELELIRTLLSLGITQDELYSYCMRENLIDALVETIGGF